MTINMNRRHFLGLIGAGSAGLFFNHCSGQRTDKKPNIVLLFADDLGYGDLSCYGHPTIKTPVLDQIADEGIRLTSYYAASSLCTPSRAGLLTGRYAVRCGLPFVLGPDATNGLPEEEITLAQSLKTAGYRTMCIGKWHIGHAKPEYMPVSRGFDHYFGLLYSNDMIPPWVQTDIPLRLYRDNTPLPESVVQDKLTEIYTEEAVKFIHQNKANPFFLYLPYTMPHLPVSASQDFRDKSRAGLYGDVIETLDWSAGKILQTLKDLHLDGNTIFIFTSDNGPWCNMPDRMLQNGIERWDAGSPGLLRGAKGTSYEGGFRVPFILRWPGHVPAGQLSAEPVSALDLLPTLLNACGAPLPSDRILDGEDVMPLFCGQPVKKQKPFYYISGTHLDAVRDGKWKYRSVKDTTVKNKNSYTSELYNLDIDPAEKYNVAGDNPDVADILQKVIKNFAIETGTSFPD